MTAETVLGFLRRLPATGWRRRAAFAVATFCLVTLGTVCSRWGSLTVDQLWLDDIQQFDAARQGLPADPLIEEPALISRPYWATHFWMLRSIPNAVAIRLVYVAVYGIAAVLAQRLLTKVVGPLAAMAIVVASFLNPATLLVFVFINGSSAVLSLLGVLAGATCLVAIFGSPSMSSRTWLTQAAFSLSCLWVVMGSSNGLPMLAAVLFLPWWRAALRADRRGFVVHAVATIGAVGATVLVGALALTASHPYARIPDRVVDGPVEAVGNGVRLLAAVLVAYVDPPLATGMHVSRLLSLTMVAAVVASLALVSGLAIWRSFRVGAPRGTPDPACRVSALDGLPFLVASAAASVAGLAVTRIFHLWHLFLPSVALVAALLLAIRPVISRRGAVIGGLALVVLTVSSFARQHDVFSASASMLDELATDIERASESWDGVDQVFVIAEPPRNVGVNQPMRSLAFVRRATGDEGIDYAFIGRQGRAERFMRQNVVDARRTHLFRFGPSDEAGSGLASVDLRFWGEEGVTASGGTDPGSWPLGRFLCQVDDAAIRLVGSPDQGWLRGRFGRTFHDVQVGEPGWHDLSVEPGASFWIELDLRADPLGFRPENAVYGETTPPMPFLGPGIALYQTPTGYDLRGLEGGQFVGDADPGGHTEILLVGCEGNDLALFVDGTFRTFLAPPAISGTWRLGSGFKQREWNGSLVLRLGLLQD